MASPYLQRFAVAMASAMAIASCALDWDSIEPTTGSAGGGAGGGAPCKPGSREACYSGPAQTEGVGACLPGEATCQADGSSYGPCEGEVVPIDEDCDTPADDNCSGEANELEAGCSCIVGELRSCYEGPAGSVGQGSCVAGQKLCIDEGNAFTACLGQVVPQAEECVSTRDENCDGSVNEGCGLWAKRFGGVNTDAGLGLAIDINDNVIVVGYAETINFGNGPRAGGGGPDLVVAKFSPAGTPLWSRGYGDGAAQLGTAVAVDGAGDVYLTGSFEGVLNVGVGSPPPTAGERDIFVLKISSTGSPLWLKRFGGAGDDFGLALAVNDNNWVAVTGSFEGSVDFGGGVLSAKDRDGFLLTLDTGSGAHLSSEFFGDAGDDGGTAIITDDSGEVHLGGFFASALALGGKTLKAVGGTDAFVARLNAAGNNWLTGVQGGGDATVSAMALSPSGDLVALGYFGGTLALPSGNVDAGASTDVFAASFGTTGTANWSKSFPGSGVQAPTSVAVNAAGQIWFTVLHNLVADYGGGTVNASGREDWVAVKLDSAGVYLKSRRFGDRYNQIARAVKVDSANNVLLTGECGGLLDLGAGLQLKQVTGSGRDLCLAKLAP